MITSKQRKYLKTLAHHIEPTVYLGKAGLTKNIENEIETGFEMREIVKVKIQESCDLKAKDVANGLSQKLNAEFIQAIGRKFVLYRESRDNKTIELPKK